MSKTFIDPKILQNASKVLRALAHPDRLRIIERLKKRKHAVGELAEALAIPQAVVSKHLARLKNTGVLASEIDFNFRYYSLANTEVLNVLDCIKKSCPNSD